MRKKHLKIELDAARRVNHTLHNTIAEQQTKLLKLGLEKADLLATIEYLQTQNAELYDSNERLLASKPAPAKGPNRPNAKKLNQREVSEVRNLKRMGLNQAEIARMYDVNPATVSRIVRGQYHGKVA